jgi:hypothetical protein
VIRVGGSTEVEVKERKDRVDDAMHATRAAVEEGVVPGRRARAALRDQGARQLTPANPDQKVGIDIVRKALQWPARQIAENSGTDGSIVVGKLLESNDPNYGYDAQKGEFTNLVQAGIIDPTKVVRHALQDAASVAGLLITTEAMVARSRAEAAMPAMPPAVAWAGWTLTRPLNGNKAARPGKPGGGLLFSALTPICASNLNRERYTGSPDPSWSMVCYPCRPRRGMRNGTMGESVGWFRFFPWRARRSHTYAGRARRRVRPAPLSSLRARTSALAPILEEWPRAGPSSCGRMSYCRTGVGGAGGFDPRSRQRQPARGHRNLAIPDAVRADRTCHSPRLCAHRLAQMAGGPEDPRRSSAPLVVAFGGPLSFLAPTRCPPLYTKVRRDRAVAPRPGLL